MVLCAARMEKDFDHWNEKKKYTHKREFADHVHEREVWWSALGVNIGVEIDGKHENFERPVLVVRKFNNDSVLVVPITSRVKETPYHVPYIHKGEKFAAVISQIRMISTKRLHRKLFSMNSQSFAQIQAALAATIQRPPLSRGPRRPHGHN